MYGVVYIIIKFLFIIIFQVKQEPFDIRNLRNTSKFCIIYSFIFQNYVIFGIYTRSVLRLDCQFKLALFTRMDFAYVACSRRTRKCIYILLYINTQQTRRITVSNCTFLETHYHQRVIRICAIEVVEFQADSSHVNVPVEQIMW